MLTSEGDKNAICVRIDVSVGDVDDFKVTTNFDNWSSGLTSGK